MPALRKRVSVSAIAFRLSKWVVTIARPGASASTSSMARASAAPCSGWVPTISSSQRINRFSSLAACERSRMPDRLARWAEKVDRSPITDC